MNGEELKLNKDIKIKYDLFRKTSTPINFIFQLNTKVGVYKDKGIIDNLGDKYFISGLELFKGHSLDFVYRILRENNINLNLDDFLMLYFISDVWDDGKKDSLMRFFMNIQNFIKDNKQKFSKTYDLEELMDRYSDMSFDILENNWITRWNNLLEESIQEEKSLKEFYHLLNDLEYSSNSKIYENIKEISKNITVQMNFSWDRETALYFFNDFVCNEKIPRCVYVGNQKMILREGDESDENLFNKPLFKVFSEDLDVQNYDKMIMSDIEENMMIFYLNLGNERIEKKEVEEEEEEDYMIYFIKHKIIILKYFYEKGILEYELPNASIDITEYIQTIFHENNLSNMDIKDMSRISGHSGYVDVEFTNFEQFLFYGMIKIDPIISSFLFVKETSSIRSLRNTLKYYYKNPGLTTKTTEKYIISFILELTKKDNIRIKYQTKEIDNNKIRDFCLVLSKIIKYYENNYENIKSIFVSSLLYRENERSVLNLAKQEKKEGTKLERLISTNPGFGFGAYGRELCSCKAQPLVITNNNDIMDWRNYLLKGSGEKRQIVVFPPLSSKDYPKYCYVSPSDEYPYVTIKKNKAIEGTNFEKFPLVVCCSKIDTMNLVYKNKKNEKGEMVNDENETVEDIMNMIPMDKDHIYLKYDMLKEGKNVEEKSTRIREYDVKNNKLLGKDKVGNIPEDLEKILEKFGTFKRYDSGVTSKVYGENNSFIGCILKAIQHSNYRTQSERYYEFVNSIINIYENSEERAIEFMRNNIYKFIEPSLLSQELYDSLDDIEYRIRNDVRSYFDPNIYTRILEVIFEVNIINISTDGIKSNIQPLRNTNYSIRILDEEKPTIIILDRKTKNGKSLHTCELVGSINYKTKYHIDEKVEGINSRTFLFDEDITKIFIEKIKNYYIEIDGKTYLSPFNNVNWEKILKNHKIIGQHINTEGKVFAFNVNLSEKSEKIITIYCMSTCPLNVPYSQEIYYGNLEIVKKYFNDKYIKGRRGVFFKQNDFEYGVFIPCKDVEVGDEGIVCKEFELEVDSRIVDDKIEKTNKEAFETNIMLQCIVWLRRHTLYSSSFSEEEKNEEDDLKKWMEVYFKKDRKTVKKMNKIPYVFPKGRKLSKKYSYNIYELIKSLHEYWPDLFGTDGKVHVYDALYDSIYGFLRFIERKTEGMNNIPNSTIVGIFKDISDFKKISENKIFKGYDNYMLWLNEGNSKEYNLKTKIGFMSKIPFYFKCTGYVGEEMDKEIIYIIQGTEDGSLTSAIILGREWKEKRINMGAIYSKKKDENNFIVFKSDFNGKLLPYYDGSIDSDYVEVLQHSNYMFSAMLKVI